MNLIFGSIRLIERDGETFLAWAKQPYACLVLNLHTVHTPDGVAAATATFRRILDLAVSLGGSYYPPITGGRPRGRLRRAIRNSRLSFAESAHTTPTSAFRATGTGTTA